MRLWCKTYVFIFQLTTNYKTQDSQGKSKVNWCNTKAPSSNLYQESPFALIFVLLKNLWCIICYDFINDKEYICNSLLQKEIQPTALMLNIDIYFNLHVQKAQISNFSTDSIRLWNRTTMAMCQEKDQNSPWNAIRWDKCSFYPQFKCSILQELWPFKTNIDAWADFRMLCLLTYRGLNMKTDFQVP